MWIYDSMNNCRYRLGMDYKAGDSYRGIWGLYGGYDYISPHIFRVSSTSLSRHYLSMVAFPHGSAPGFSPRGAVTLRPVMSLRLVNATTTTASPRRASSDSVSSLATEPCST